MISLSIRPVLGLYETSGSLAVKADTLSSSRSALLLGSPCVQCAFPLDSLKKVPSLY